MSKSTTLPVPAAAVRAFFSDEAKGAARLAALPSDLARKSVLPGARGRLSKEAIAAFNKGKTPARRYVTGNTNEVSASMKADALTLRVKAFEAGEAVGQRGPLSNAAKAAAGVKVAKRRAARAKA